MNQRKSDCRRSGLASSTSDTVHCRSASECMLMSSSTDKNGNATTIRHNQADDEKSKLFVAAKNNVTVRTVLLPICCSISLFCVVFCVWRTIRLEMRIANLEQQLDSVEHIAKFSLTNVEYERLRLLIGNNALNSTLYFESTSRSPRSATTIKRCVCPPGPAGPPGLQGEKGDVGPIGLPGNPGSPAKPLQGSKLFPDSLHFLLADKSLNDEQDDKVIDSRWSTSHFIKGEPGANGTPGQPGPPGQPGLPGPPGNDGRPGFDGMIKIGDKGEIGLPGPAGKPGGEGPIGAPGEKGDKGDKGSLTTLFNGKATVIECLPGPQGPPGPKGDKGDAGLIGLPGEKGKRGRRGKGEKGDKGISGEKGSVCEPSPPGEKGERGERGKTGVRGKHGNKGDKGDQGIPGLDAPCPLAPDGLPLPGCGWKPIKVKSPSLIKCQKPIWL